MRFEMIKLIGKGDVRPRVAAAVLASGIFLLDLLAPQGIAVSVLYAAIVPISLWSRHQRDLILTAVGCTVLIGLDLMLAEIGPSLTITLANRAIGVVAVWTIALLALQRRRTEEGIELLSELSDLLQACLSTQEAYAVIRRVAPQLFPSHAGALCVISKTRNLVEIMAEWPDTAPRERMFEPTDCWALRRGRVHFVEDAETGTLCNHVERPAPDSYLCVPMMAQGEPLGVLYLQPLDGRSAPIDEKRAIIVAERIALALANLKLRAALQNLSFRDPLTGLFNRRYMEESLERELRRAVRNQHPVGVILCDLDHFKQFNDTFGHEAGDALLRQTGTVLPRLLRASDIACRYGGEEFMLILPEACLETVLKRADRVRTAIRQLKVQHGTQLLGPVTLSIGIALFPDHGQTGEAVLRAADIALYQAKTEGRDRVVVAEPVETDQPL